MSHPPADPARTTVLLVDDHAVVREGYRRLLERDPTIRVVGECADAAQACGDAVRLNPDVVVMDISLPDVSGIEALRRLLLERPSQTVLMFSMHDDAIFVSRAFETGARGYITKASAPDVLVSAIRTVASGERFVSADLEHLLDAGAVAQSPAAPRLLTSREMDVLRLLVRGATVKEIGATLGISEKTVANHQSAIREAFGAKNSVQLARAAKALGLIVTTPEGA